jgi:hypothetical protein
MSKEERQLQYFQKVSTDERYEKYLSKIPTHKLTHIKNKVATQGVYTISPIVKVQINVLFFLDVLFLKLMIMAN